MISYYSDTARKSLWVLTKKQDFSHDQITCFAAEKDSGFHIGQRINNPKLENSNWQPLEGEISLSELLHV